MPLPPPLHFLARVAAAAAGLVGLHALAAVAVGLCVPACSTNDASAGVGDPCVPQLEYTASFGGFDEREVSIESASMQCASRTCLVNHFRGRVSCPYGQAADGSPPRGAVAGCTVPGSSTPVRPTARDGVTVDAQCIDRTAAAAVYCSCRCANAAGRTDDGAIYCGCPDGFHCAALVSAANGADRELAGSYCVKDRTDFDPNAACASSCDATIASCGPGQGVSAAAR